MGNKSTKLTLKVSAVDKATAVFKRVGTVAAGVAKSALAIGAAAGAASAVMLKTWDAMTKVNDLATASGETAENLQKMTAAMGQLGIQGMSLEGVAKALEVMRKNTGGNGIEGFIAAIDKAKGAADPIKSLTESFGKSGLALAPILAGDSDALRELIELQFAASNGAITAATDASNAWSMFKSGALAAWYEFSGEVAKLLDENVEGGIYAAAYKGVAYVTAAVKSIKGIFDVVVGLAKEVGYAIYTPFEVLGKAIAAVAASVSTFSSGPLKEFWNDLQNLDSVSGMFEGGEQFLSGIDRISNSFAEAMDKAKNAAKDAARLTDLKSRAAGTYTGKDSVGAVSSVGAARNALIMGGSYASVSALTARNNDAAKTRIATEASAASLKNIESHFGNFVGM